MKLKFYLIGLGMGMIVTAIIMGIVLGFRRSSNTSMSDEEVMARARELGMVESTVLLSEGQGNAYGDNTTIVTPPPVSDQGNEADSADPGEGETDTKDPLVITGESEEGAGTGEEGNGTGEEGEPGGAGTDIPDGGTDQTGNDAQESSAAQNTQGTAGGTQTDQAGQDDSRDAAANQQGSDTDQAAGGSIVVTIPDGYSSEGICELLQAAGVIDNAVSFNTWLVQTGRDRYIGTGARLIPRGSSYDEIGRIITGR